MPVVPNSFFQSSPTAVDMIGPALSRLSQAFISGPSAGQQNLLQARTQSANQTAALGRAKRREIEEEGFSRGRIADIFKTLPGLQQSAENAPATDFVGPRLEPQLLGEQAQSDLFSAPARLSAEAARGGVDPSAITELFRNIMANTAGTSPDQIGRAMLGAGGGETNVKGALTLGLSPDDQRTSLLGPQAFGPTETQVNANTLQNEGTREDRLIAARGREPADKGLQSLIIVTPDGQQRPGFFDPGKGGVFLSDGAPAPEGSRTFKTPQVVDTSEGAGLTTSTETGLQKAQIARERFRGFLGITRSLAQDESNFGIPGLLKGARQDAGALLSGVSQGLGFESTGAAINDARVKAAQSQGLSAEIAASLFDPNLPALQAAANLLVFSGASALAGQSGRDISDRDVQLFRKTLGDPTSLFENKERFAAKLALAEELVNSLDNADAGFTGGRTGGSGGGSTAGTPTHRFDPASGRIVPIQ